MLILLHIFSQSLSPAAAISSLFWVSFKEKNCNKEKHSMTTNFQFYSYIHSRKKIIPSIFSSHFPHLNFPLLIVVGLLFEKESNQSSNVYTLRNGDQIEGDHLEYLYVLLGNCICSTRTSSTQYINICRNGYKDMSRDSAFHSQFGSHWTEPLRPFWWRSNGLIPSSAATSLQHWSTR